MGLAIDVWCFESEDDWASSDEWEDVCGKCGGEATTYREESVEGGCNFYLWTVCRECGHAEGEWPEDARLEQENNEPLRQRRREELRRLWKKERDEKERIESILACYGPA